MAGKTNLTATLFSQKKLSGKASTGVHRSDVQEPVPSAVQISTAGIFSQDVPPSPAQTLWSLQGVAGKPNTIEYVEFSITQITGSQYDANNYDSGAEAQSSGVHAYRLELPSNYESNSSNPRKGEYPFLNGQILHWTLGSLQIVPPTFSNDEPNPFMPKLWKGSNDISDVIPLLDDTDWGVDYYNGVLLVQDYDSTKVPTRARGFIYVGEMLSASLGNISQTNSVQKEGWIAPASAAIATTGSLLIGTNTATKSNSDIHFSGLGAATFNVQKNNADFTVSSMNKDTAIMVDSDTNKVLILSGGAEASNNEAKTLDVSFYVSGSTSAFNGISGGLALFGGDVVISGSLRDGSGNLIGASAGSTVDNDGDTKIQVEESADEDKIRFDTAGSERMIIDNAGSVGFGLSNPQKQVHIYNSTTSSLRIGAHGSSEQNDSNLEFCEQTDGSGNMVYGFSQTYDAAKNHFVLKNHNNTNSGRHAWTTTRDGGKHFFGVEVAEAAGDFLGSDNYFFVSGSIDSRGTSASGVAVFGGDVVVSGTLSINRSDAGGFSMVTVTTDGKVGIGTDNPGNKLSVGGNMDVGEYIYHKNDANTYIRFQDDDINIQCGGRSMIKMREEASIDQVLILSGGSSTSSDPKSFSDTNFFVSGSIGSRGTSIDGTSVFGGDTVTSGTISFGIASNWQLDDTTWKLGDADQANLTYDGSLTTGNFGIHGKGATKRANLLIDGGIKVGNHSSADSSYIENGNFGIGTTNPSTIFHIEGGSPEARIQRNNQNQTSALTFAGSSNVVGSSISHEGLTNDLVFKTFGNGGASLEEILRLGGYYSADNRQVIFLSGSGMDSAAVQPEKCSDVAFFVSGSIGSAGTSEKGTSVFGGDVVVSGSINVLGAGGVNFSGGNGSNNQMITADGTGNIVAENNITFNGSQLTVTGHILPGADSVYNLGSDSMRFANMYTGDLHLRNERGHWTIVEEAEYLTVINNLNGKKYKMVLEPIE